VKKTELNIYLSDGRIDANKAFKLVLDKMMTMSNEEFCKVVETPVTLRGTDGAVVRDTSTKPKQDNAVVMSTKACSNATPTKKPSTSSSQTAVAKSQRPRRRA